jgi:dTDP-D-glucose 4,6-dehydratase
MRDAVKELVTGGAGFVGSKKVYFEGRKNGYGVFDRA